MAALCGARFIHAILPIDGRRGGGGREGEREREREREDLRLAGDKECGEARTCGGWQEGGRAGVAVTVKTKKGGGEREREREREREQDKDFRELRLVFAYCIGFFC